MQFQGARENRKRGVPQPLLYPCILSFVRALDCDVEVHMMTIVRWAWQGGKDPRNTSWHLSVLHQGVSKLLNLLDLGPLQSQMWKEICKKGHNAVFEMWYVGCNHGVNSEAYSILCMEFLQVVPTVYTDIRGRRIVSNQVCLVICCQEVDHTFFSFKLGS
jgi:hypothetical protein